MSSEEGNKIIAEFMGWEFQNKKYNWEHSRIDRNTWVDLEKVGHYELSFHSSWDWLMPVVEKIEALGCYATELLRFMKGHYTDRITGGKEK